MDELKPKTRCGNCKRRRNGIAIGICAYRLKSAGELTWQDGCAYYLAKAIYAKG